MAGVARAPKLGDLVVGEERDRLEGGLGLRQDGVLCLERRLHPLVRPERHECSCGQDHRESQTDPPRSSGWGWRLGFGLGRGEARRTRGEVGRGNVESIHLGLVEGDVKDGLLVLQQHEQAVLLLHLVEDARQRPEQAVVVRPGEVVGPRRIKALGAGRLRV